MKGNWFKIVLALIVLLVRLCPDAWTQEKKNDILSITPAITFSWYPYADFYKESSTETKLDLNNFGMSITMNLKFFDKVGVHLNLTIDDPTFKKTVGFAGYLTASYFLLKFDYHAFGGTVTWTGNTPNPIPDGVYNFRNQWNNISLFLRVDQLPIEQWIASAPNLLWFLYMPLDFLYSFGLIGGRNLGAIGIGYANFDMPLKYMGKSDSELSNPGFGLITGNVWGFTMLWDTLTRHMELPVYQGSDLSVKFLNAIWLYVDCFFGFPTGKGKTDEQAIAWMSNANNGVSVNGNINGSVEYSIFKIILGLQHVWDVGKKGRIGLAAGVEILEETISATNNDINVYFRSRHIGPAVRLSVRW